MPGGRPRKPRALKLVQGTDRPDRANPSAPAPRVRPMGPPPGHLNAHEKRTWVALAQLVDPLRIATGADVVAFEHLAVCLGMINAARESLNEAGGLTYEVITESGGTAFRKRPEVEVIATYERLLDAKLGRFGLTPAEREKVSAADDEKRGANPLDQFRVV